MKITYALFLLTICSTICSAQAKNYKDGNYLLEACSDTDGSFQRGVCTGYIEGISDLGEGKLFCIPDKVIFNQMDKVVLKYLNDHPERLHEDKRFLTVAAMAKAFPCSVKNQKP